MVLIDALFFQLNSNLTIDCRMNSREIVTETIFCTKSMTIIIRSHLVWSILLKRTSTLPHLHLAKIINLHSCFSGVGTTQHKVSVQGVVALGGHFATLCRELDFYDAFFSI